MRRKLLQKLLKKNDTLRYVDHVENDGLHLVAGALALGLEGIIARDKNSPYIEGPTETWHWQKSKTNNISGKKRSNSDNDKKLHQTSETQLIVSCPTGMTRFCIRPPTTVSSP